MSKLPRIWDGLEKGLALGHSGFGVGTLAENEAGFSPKLPVGFRAVAALKLHAIGHFCIAQLFGSMDADGADPSSVRFGWPPVAALRCDLSRNTSAGMSRRMTAPIGPILFPDDVRADQMRLSALFIIGKDSVPPPVKLATNCASRAVQEAVSFGQSIRAIGSGLDWRDTHPRGGDVPTASPDVHLMPARRNACTNWRWNRRNKIRRGAITISVAAEMTEMLTPFSGAANNDSPTVRGRVDAVFVTISGQRKLFQWVEIETSA